MRIRTLLVANRGEIAIRIFSTARSLGIRCVAVYTDADVNSPHVAAADLSVRLAGSYASSADIIEAAALAGADSVHPGYGFGSESPAFARSIEDAGLLWIGPRPETIATMGDKIRAKTAATAAGIRCLPGTNDISDADTIGFPLMVKAAAGGGGKGMRVVTHGDDLQEAIASCQRESAKSFGDDTVFVERYVARARHIEVQIAGDRHGNLIHLGERECSIQRRHQKVIEESPSPGITAHQRQGLVGAAVKLGRSLGYESVGTVEFILDEDSGEFFFCETNTRLQVEHPVTEQVSGVDLVEWQLLVAEGGTLPLSQPDVSYSGHSIEARIYAEDPAGGFLPATGTIEAIDVPTSDHLRWESGISLGLEIGMSFDPLLAKMVSHGRTRVEAINRLIRGLESLHLGGVSTNRAFLLQTLDDRDFRRGRTLTSFIEDHPPLRVDPNRELAAMMAAMWLQGRNRAEAPVLAMMPSGWRNARTPPEEVRFQFGGDSDPIAVRYRARRDTTFDIATDTEDGEDTTAIVHAWFPESIDVSIGSLRISSRVSTVGDNVHVQLPTGTTTMRIVPRFAAPDASTVTSGFSAPMPGQVAEIRVEDGEGVFAGQTLIVLEAMKMEHHVTAPTDGVVQTVLVSENEQVRKGQDLLVFEEAEGD